MQASADRSHRLPTLQPLRNAEGRLTGRTHSFFVPPLVAASFRGTLLCVLSHLVYRNRRQLGPATTFLLQRVAFPLLSLDSSCSLQPPLPCRALARRHHMPLRALTHVRPHS